MGKARNGGERRGLEGSGIQWFYDLRSYQGMEGRGLEFNGFMLAMAYLKARIGSARIGQERTGIQWFY